MIPSKNKKLLSLACIALLAWAIPVAQGQFPEIANSIFGPDSYFRGVRNVLGGVLGADNVHKKCLQKTLCDEFAPAIVEVSERYDPVKRSMVRIPRVIKQRGRLRWIGDLVSRGVGKVASRLGVNPWGFKRRQGGEATLAARAVEFIVANWQKIPVQQIFHVMDFAADITGGMERKGAVYPYFKASTLGYNYGAEKSDDFDGVCAQVAPDCGGWWGHLETVNEYDGGSLSRKAAERIGTATRSGDVDPNNPLVWNNMKAEDILAPKVFLCKASLFLEKLNENMGGDGVVKEKFGSEDFQATCNPHKISAAVEESVDSVSNSVSTAEGDLPLSSIEIIDARLEVTTVAPFDSGGFGELPLIVLEGLPEPRVDQSDEELVESILQLVNLPQASVRTALRLPMRTRGKSIVLVEMDTPEHQEEVIEHKEDLRLFRNALLKIGIRRARYKELWRYVKQLMTVRSTSEEPDLSLLQETTDEDAEVVDGEEGQQDIITGIDESDASILESNGDNEDLQDYVTNILQESVNEDETISDSDEAAIITSDRDGEPKKK